MIYKGYQINAEVDQWTVFEVNDDGSLGDMMYITDADPDFPRYAVWSLDQDGEPDEGCGETDSIASAKAAIDELVKSATTIQSVHGN